MCLKKHQKTITFFGCVRIISEKDETNFKYLQMMILLAVPTKNGNF